MKIIFIRQSWKKLLVLSMECFAAAYLRIFTENVKIWLLGRRLGTRHQIQAFQ